MFVCDCPFNAGLTGGRVYDVFHTSMASDFLLKVSTVLVFIVSSLTSSFPMFNIQVVVDNIFVCYTTKKCAHFIVYYFF